MEKIYKREPDPQWRLRTDNKSYQALHYWVKKHLGKPQICWCCGSKDLPPNRYHWANVSGQYRQKLWDWVRLCNACHSAFDR